MQKHYPFILLVLICCIQCQRNTKLSDVPLTDNAVVAYNIDKMIGAPLDIQSQREREYSQTFEFVTADSMQFKIRDEEAILIFQKIKEWDNAGDFHHIIIRYKGEQCRFLNVEGWIIPDAGIANLSDFGQYDAKDMKSAYVQKASDDDWLLFLFGCKSTDNLPLLTVINMTRFEKPELIYNDCGMLCDFTDWNNDGAKDLEVSGYLDDSKVDPSYEQIFRRYYLLNGYYTVNAD